jgi:hypothetical protein
MKLKRAILAELSRDELKDIVEQLELADVDRRSAETMREALARSRRASPKALIEHLGEGQIKAVCQAVGLDATGRPAMYFYRDPKVRPDRYGHETGTAIELKLVNRIRQQGVAEGESAGSEDSAGRIERDEDRRRLYGLRPLRLQDGDRQRQNDGHE